MLLALGTALWVAVSVAPEYRATGTLLVVTPNPPVKVPGGGPPVRDNPYAEFTRSLDVMADVAVASMTSELARQRMQQAGVPGKYEVGVGPEGGPMITVVTNGATPQESLNNFELVSKGVQDDIVERQIQAGATPELWIRAEVLTLPKPAVVVGSSLRAFAAVAVLGLAAVASLTFVLEARTRRQASARGIRSYAYRRRRTRRSRRAFLA